jgi:DNA invertase Pin-like site-specific DNA recombinase
MIRKIPNNSNIIIYNITRFSRNVLQGLSVLDKLNKRGVKIYSVMEKCWYHSNATTADKHLFRSTLCVAENESNMISDRVRGSFSYIRSQGGHIGKVPYGFEAYRDDNKRRKIRKCKGEQLVINKILKLRVTKTISEIVEYLNSKQILNRDNLWSYSSISNICKKNLQEITNSFEEILI